MGKILLTLIFPMSSENSFFTCQQCLHRAAKLQTTACRTVGGNGFTPDGNGMHSSVRVLHTACWHLFCAVPNNSMLCYVTAHSWSKCG